jgi:predicted NAD/FAD-binding protein
MKIAVVGTGIAGNIAAWKLARDHDVTVFEAASRIGGHTNTLDVELDGQVYAVDTGFIVFNGRTYPNFIAMLDELDVAWQDSDMSFSVRHHRTGLEYNGSNLNGLFAQRSNLFRPRFHGMIRDILRFNREAPKLLEPGAADLTLSEYLDQENYSQAFVENFILPMGAAIWSASKAMMQQMPARFLVRFFDNHGMLSVNDRPVWRVIKGGSRSYVDKLVAGHRERIHLNSPVERVQRFPEHVSVKVWGQEPQRFDQVFIASHSDQALNMLADPSPLERQVLGAIRYQPNEAVLHTDAFLMPKRRRAWAAWNAHITDQTDAPVAVTYNMNILQDLKAPKQFLVTLNHDAGIRSDRVIERIHYQHPVFTPEAVAAQKQHANVNGIRRTYFCGAYWRYGFHEDGVVSALDALQHFEDRRAYEKRDLQRAS